MKRFTDTDKWEDKWFRNLKPNEKLLFLYLIDKCNLAGFIEIDIPLISFHTGLSEEDILGAKQGLNRGYLGANNHIWIKNFLKHQKNLPLNPDNNAHKHILLCLSEQSGRFKLKEIFNYLGADMGLISPIGKGKGISIGKDNGKSKGEEGTNLINTIPAKKDFENFWENYPRKVGKGAALKSWGRLTIEEKAKIPDALAWQKESEQWKKDNGQYIPHPSTYLNQRRWEDELTIIKKKTYADIIREDELAKSEHSR